MIFRLWDVAWLLDLFWMWLFSLFRYILSTSFLTLKYLSQNIFKVKVLWSLQCLYVSLLSYFFKCSFISLYEDRIRWFSCTSGKPSRNKNLGNFILKALFELKFQFLLMKIMFVVTVIVCCVCICRTHVWFCQEVQEWRKFCAELFRSKTLANLVNLLTCLTSGLVGQTKLLSVWWGKY